MSRPAALKRQLTNIADSLDGRVGLSVRLLPEDVEMGIDSDGIYTMASVFKIPILVELLCQAEAGEVDLNDRVKLQDQCKVAGSGVLPHFHAGLAPTLRDLATLMIIVSDNTATDLVLQRVGPDQVTARMRSLGLAVTRVNANCTHLLAKMAGVESGQLSSRQQLRHMFEQSRKKPPEERGFISAEELISEKIDVSTPGEMTRLLHLLESGDIVGDRLTETALDILRAQKLNTRIPALLPEGARVAHKTGTLSDVVCDVGIMYPPAWQELPRRAILSVFTAEVADRRDATRTIAELSRAVYESHVAADQQR